MDLGNTDLETRIRETRLRSALAINSELIGLYGRIGRDAKVVDRLADGRRAEFPETRGSSATLDTGTCRFPPVVRTHRDPDRELAFWMMRLTSQRSAPRADASFPPSMTPAGRSNRPPHGSWTVGLDSSPHSIFSLPLLCKHPLGDVVAP